MNYEKLYEKIREAQPEKDWIICACEQIGKKCDFTEISLADTMLALNEYFMCYVLVISLDGHILERHSSDELGLITYEGTGKYWDFTKPLHLQSKPLLLWLAGVLNVKVVEE